MNARPPAPKAVFSISRKCPVFRHLYFQTDTGILLNSVEPCWNPMHGLRPSVRQAVDATATVRWVFLQERDPLVQNEIGRGSGGALCWRAPRQGIPCWKLIPMSPGRATARPAVLNKKGHRNRFPHASENSTSRASTRVPLPAAPRTRRATGIPAPSAVASDCRSVR